MVDDDAFEFDVEFVNPTDRWWSVNLNFSQNLVFRELEPTWSNSTPKVASHVSRFEGTFECGDYIKVRPHRSENIQNTMSLEEVRSIVGSWITSESETVLDGRVRRTAFDRGDELYVQLHVFGFESEESLDETCMNGGWPDFSDRPPEIEVDFLDILAEKYEDSYGSSILKNWPWP